jgi:hypothetical protein
MLRPAIDLAGIDLADLTSICLVLMAIFDVVASEDLGLLVCLIALRDDPVVCAVFPLFMGMSWAGSTRRRAPRPGLLGHVDARAHLHLKVLARVLTEAAKGSWDSWASAYRHELRRTNTALGVKVRVKGT